MYLQKYFHCEVITFHHVITHTSVSVAACYYFISHPNSCSIQCHPSYTDVWWILTVSAELTRTCTAKWKSQLLLFQSDPARTATCGGGEWWGMFRTAATLMFMFLCDMTGDLAICVRKSASFKLCCLLHCGTSGCISVSNSLFLIHMLLEMFLILFIYCRYIMSNLAYWYLLVTVTVSTHYLRHSVTYGWCMFCFMTFKYIFIFKTWQRR